MRLQQQVGHDRRSTLSGASCGEARLRVRAEIGIGPAVEANLPHPDQVIGGQVVAEAVAFLHPGPQIAGLRVEGSVVGLRVPQQKSPD